MTEPTNRPRWWDGRWAGAAVVAIVLAVYAPTLVLGRVTFDDPWLWADDHPLRAPTAQTFRDVFFELDAVARHPLGADYAPVRDLTVAADMAVWGDNEHGPHATQLALFALSVLALGALLAGFGFARPVAWLGALVWALHPMRVESVAWLSDRKDVLAGLFVFACGLAWLRYRRGGSRGWLVLGVLAAIAATWSKAPAMCAPAVLGALDLLLLAAARRRWIAIAAIGIATALAAVPVIIVDRGAGIIASTDAPAPGRFASALGAEGHYALSLALVRPVAISYPIQSDGPSGVDLAAGVLAVLGSLALVWRCRRAQPMALLAWAWICFLPIGQLLVPVHIFVADRYAYLWSVAPLVGLVLAIEQLPRARAYLAALLVCALAVITLRAEAPWTSSTALFAHALESSPGDPLAYRSLGLAWYGEGDPARGLDTIERGLVAHPAHVKLLLARVLMLDALHRHAEAVATARTAAATGAASAQWTLATMLARDGQLAEALPFARAARDKHPEIAAYASTYEGIERALTLQRR